MIITLKKKKEKDKLIKVLATKKGEGYTSTVRIVVRPKPPQPSL